MLPDTAAYTTLADFLRNNTMLELPNGPVVMAVCCAVWLLSIVSEIITISNVVRATVGKIGDDTIITERNNEARL